MCEQKINHELAALLLEIARRLERLEKILIETQMGKRHSLMAEAGEIGKALGLKNRNITK
jgi:hypothetical protein